MSGAPAVGTADGPAGSADPDAGLAPLSALQHLAFCRRQCALIHLEGAWAENVLTAEGRVLHERADSDAGERRRGVRIARALPLRSLALGLTGKADVVEFHPRKGGPPVPFPVEYKRGRPKGTDADVVQLCAQALCLEEMLERPVPAGALFYGGTRRRLEVAFTPELRARTAGLAAALHALLAAGEMPAPEPGPKCRSCSLADACLPTRARGRSVALWLDGQLRAAIDANRREEDADL